MSKTYCTFTDVTSSTIFTRDEDDYIVVHPAPLKNQEVTIPSDFYKDKVVYPWDTSSDCEVFIKEHNLL